mgnify:CR=1 FL=1
MERTADQAWGITALRQVVAQTIVHEVGHALRWSGLLHVALLPTMLFQDLLEVHHGERILQEGIERYGTRLGRYRLRRTCLYWDAMLCYIFHYILRMRLHHHARIAPGCATITCSCR